MTDMEPSSLDESIFDQPHKQFTAEISIPSVDWKLITRNLQHGFLQLCNKYVTYKHTMEVLGVISVSIDNKQHELIVKINNTLKRMQLPQSEQPQQTLQQQQMQQQFKEQCSNRSLQQQTLQNCKEHISNKSQQQLAKKVKTGLNKDSFKKSSNKLENMGSSTSSTLASDNLKNQQDSSNIESNVHSVDLNNDKINSSSDIKVFGNKSSVPTNELAVICNKITHETSFVGTANNIVASNFVASVDDEQIIEVAVPSQRQSRMRTLRKCHGRKQSTPLKLSHVKNMEHDGIVTSYVDDDVEDAVSDACNKNNNIESCSLNDDDEKSSFNNSTNNNEEKNESHDVTMEDNDINLTTASDAIHGIEIGTDNGTSIEASSDTTTYMCATDEDDLEDGEDDDEMLILPASSVDFPDNNSVQIKGNENSTKDHVGPKVQSVSDVNENYDASNDNSENALIVFDEQDEFDTDNEEFDDDEDNISDSDVYPPKRKKQTRKQSNSHGSKTTKDHLRVCSTLRAMLTEPVDQIPSLLTSATIPSSKKRCVQGANNDGNRTHPRSLTRNSYVVIAPDKNDEDCEDDEVVDDNVKKNEMVIDVDEDGECVLKSAVLSGVIHIKEEVENDDVAATSIPHLKGACVLDSSQYNVENNKQHNNITFRMQTNSNNTFSTARQILPAPSTNILTNPILAILPNGSALQQQPHQQQQIINQQHQQQQIISQQLQQQQANMPRLLQPTTLFTISDEAGNSLNNCFSLQLTQLAKNVLNVSGNTTQFPLVGSSLQTQQLSSSAAPLLSATSNTRLIASKPPQKNESDFVVDAFADNLNNMTSAATTFSNNGNNNNNSSGKKFCRRRLNEDILSAAELAEYVGTCDEVMSAPSIQRPYLCSSCQATCPSLIDYFRHTLNEHNTFICHQCGKHFTTKSSLLRHRPIHTGLRRFACAICCKAFYRKDKCKAHIKKHLNSDSNSIVSINNSLASGNNDGTEIKTGYIVLSSSSVDIK